ncbi:non-ribosomal peptide synthetase, partial [candidate division KSB1 bacterium]
MTVDQSTEFEEQAVPFDEEEVYVFPTSFGQRRFWFLDQFEPGSPYYNIPLAIRVRGRFDIGIFKRVIDEIVDRHEILRTTFWPEKGEPLQIIAPELHLDIPVVDLTHLHGEKLDEEIKRLATVEARTPFDLAKGPLFRVTILKASETDHVLLVTMHHIISDGWSIGVLIREITALYAAFSQGKPSPLPELPIQYADFAEWQREYLQGEVLEEQLNFWKKQLGSNPPVLELPTDRPRPQIQTNVGASERMVFPKELTDKLYGLARQEGATLFMVLLAGLRVLLGRYAGQSDLTIGTPIANRNRAEIEPLIGLFINTLVLRNQFDDNPTFREMIRRERQITLSAYDHQDLPFEYLVDALQPSRDMSYPPLFQVMLILQNAPMKGTQVGDLSFEQIDVDMGTSTHDLTFSITENPNGLVIDVEYNTDLFERTTIQRLLRHYRQLFEAVTADPEQRVLNVNFLSPEEIKQIIEYWNATDAPREPDVCIHHLFERRVAENPQAVAVVAPGEAITYEALNRRANQLARYLHAQGVGPETVVGIMLDRQVHLLQAVLGVVKAGGAYLPLDPSYPQERLSYMLQDARVPVLICQKELQDLIPAEFEGRVLLLDEEQSRIEKLDDSNPAFPVHPDNLVYMIYTSGST